jgi:hypothetical protein
MGRLSGVTCWLPSFADIRGRRIGCDFMDLGDRVGLSPSLGTRGASIGCNIHSGETLVLIFCGLENAVKNFVMISWSCTNGSVCWAKWRLLVA